MKVITSEIKQYRITLNGKMYLLVGDAITTEDDYKNGRLGYAHISEDGFIRRFGSIIGTEDDIEIISEENVAMSLDGIANMFDRALSVFDDILGESSEL